jgi:hypothetical protein
VIPLEVDFAAGLKALVISNSAQGKNQKTIA